MFVHSCWCISFICLVEGIGFEFKFGLNSIRVVLFSNRKEKEKTENPNQHKTHTNPAQNPASSPARPALSSGPKPKPKIQPSPQPIPFPGAQPALPLAQHAWPNFLCRPSPLLPLSLGPAPRGPLSSRGPARSDPPPVSPSHAA